MQKQAHKNSFTLRVVDATVLVPLPSLCGADKLSLPAPTFNFNYNQRAMIMSSNFLFFESDEMEMQERRKVEVHLSCRTSREKGTTVDKYPKYR